MGLKIVEAPTMRDLNTEPKQKPKLLSIVLTDIINTIKTVKKFFNTSFYAKNF